MTDLDYDDFVPEVLLECEECGGEGSIEEYETVSRWSIDPPCGYARPCKACGGAGFEIVEAEGDRP